MGERRFDPGPRFAVLLKPVTLDDWLNVVGIALFSLIFAMAVAATLAARRSTVSSLDTDTSA